MIEYCVLVYWCVLGVLCLVEVYFIHVGPGCTFGVLVAVYCVLVAGYSVLAVLCCVLLGKSWLWLDHLGSGDEPWHQH